jgi:WD40 repeat protein
LQDNTHILSGSYDKKINVYNFEQGRFVYNLPANQTSVTGAIINRAGTKVITCGLDKALNVWQISKNNGKVETLFLERKIQNDVLICSMVASSFQNEFVVVGTKDGKIKMINIEKG